MVCHAAARADAEAAVAWNVLDGQVPDRELVVRARDGEHRLVGRMPHDGGDGACDVGSGPTGCTAALPNARKSHTLKLPSSAPDASR